MNKTYKVIYNRTRCMYQVVSELAKGHTKSETPEMLKSLFSKHSGLTRGIVMAVLSMSLSMPVGVAVQAADTAGTGETTTSISDTTTSNTSDTTTTAADTNLSNLTDTGKGVITTEATTVVNTAIDNKVGSLDANGNYIQKDASVSSNLSTLDTQVKSNADKIGTLDANGNYIQKDTSVSSNLSTLDTQVNTNATNISTNTADINRLKSLSNISSDAETVIKKQAKQAVKVAASGNATVTTTGSVNDGSILTYTINVSNNGAIASGDTNLVSGGTLYTELRPASTGYYISNANTTAANLIALDAALNKAIAAMDIDMSDSTTYTSKLSKYFKVNPEVTTSTDGKTKTYAPDAAANGTNSVAIGPSAQAGEKTTDATTSTTTVTGGTSSTAIGDRVVANGDKSVALGYNSQVLNASGSTTAVSGSTAIGNGAKVEGGSDSAALGTGATVDTASNAMALGKGATINKTAASGVAIGNGAVTGSSDTTKTVDNVTYNVKAAGGEDSVAIGTSASSAGNTSIALGKGASIENDTDGSYQAVVKSDDIAIGTEAKTSASNSSTAIGKSATVSQSTDALAIGSSASVGASSDDAMALGKGAAVGSGAKDSIAMGTSAKTVSADTIAIGQNTSATGANSVVIGKGATTTEEGGNAIGSSSTASGNSTAIGQSATANNYYAVAIGNGATANADKSIALGYNAGVGTSEGRGEQQNAGSLIAIGTSSGNNVSGMQNVAIGEGAGSNVKSNYNIAIGTQAGYGINYASDDKSQNGYNVSIGYQANYQENSANIMYSTALGNEANASNYAVAIGDKAKASGTYSLALGDTAQASDTESIALGHNTNAADGNIAIGNGSLAPAVSSLGTVQDGYVYKSTTTTDSSGTSTTTLTELKAAFTYKPLASDSHYISVGNSTLTRRISNVADGVFDSDAATVGQLNSLNELLQATDTKVGLTKDYFEQKFTDLNTTIDSSKTHYFSISESSDNLSGNKDNTGATSNKADAMAIGPNANATNVKSLAVGNNVYATGLRSIAIGTAPNPTTDAAGTTTTHNTSAEGENSIALGTSTTAQADNSVAIGTRAQTYTTDTTGNTGVSSVAIGNLATTAGNQSVALGYNATVKYNYGTAIGAEALASGDNAVAIGKGSKAYSTDSMAIGQDNSVTGNNVYGLGSSNSFSGEWGAITQSGVSGYKNTVTSVSDQDTTNALTGIYVTGNSNTFNQNVKYNVMQDITVQGSSNKIDGGAGGTSSHQNTLSQIAIVGSGNTVQGKSSDDGKTNNIKDVTILGYNNKVDANTDTTVDFSNTQILGNNVTAALGNSVYLGNNAAYVQPTSPAQDAIDAAKTAADTAAEASDEYKAATTDEVKATIKAEYEAKYLYKLRVQAMEATGSTAGMNSYSTDETYGNGTSYTYAGSNPTGVVTVGSVGSERRIQNVAAGLVSASSTDAVNGSQLYALTRQIRFGGDNSSFGDTAAGDTNVVARGSNETISITGGSDAVTVSTTDGKTAYTVDSTKLTDNNIAVVADTDTSALHIQLASNLQKLNTASLGSGNGDSYKETIKLDGTGTNGGTLTLEDASGANGVTLRTSGSTTTADVNGTATTRLLVNDKTVATTDDGLKFGGDTGTDSARKMNSKLTVKGGATDASKLTDNNIGVVSDGSGTLTVKLNKNVDLGTDGSLTTGAVTATTVTADTVTSGNSTLNTNGLIITNGPSVLATGINADSKKITNVSDGEANADAANYGQVKAAKTTLSKGNNNVTITPDTASADGHTNYTVSVSNLSYKAGTDTTAKDVALATGLTFNNGKNTTAVVGDNGTITYNLNDKIELGSETDSNNHIVVDGTKGLLTLGMDATINGNAGTASIGGVSIGKSGSDQTVTGLSNRTWVVGKTTAVSGRAATEDQLKSVSDAADKNAQNITTLQQGFTVTANGKTDTKSTVKAGETLNFQAGKNVQISTTAGSKSIEVALSDTPEFTTVMAKDANGNITTVSGTGVTITPTGTGTQSVSLTSEGLDNGNHVIKNVADATQDTDAATLGQVKKARTKVTAGSNVAGVDSSEDLTTHQMTYMVNVDNLSVKANNEAAKSVTLKNGLTFNNGNNTTASVGDNGEVKYDLNSTLTGLTSVTAGNSTLDTNGLTIKEGTAPKVVITSGNVTMGGNVIHNVGGGVAATDAVNKGQLDALQTQVSGGWNLVGNNAEGNAVTAKIGAGKTVTYGDGNYTKSVVTKDDTTGNATVKVDVTTGTFGSGTGDKAGTVTSTADGLATTQDVANAINRTSISVVADNTPENKTAVKAGDTIHFAKDGNLTLTQNGATFTYGLNNEINISKVTTSDTTKGSTVQTVEGITTKDAAGNTYEQTANGITLTPKTPGTGKTAVSLTNTGLNNGNNVISGVGAGSADTDAVNVSQLKKVQDQVGSGWQIAGNDGTKVADIGAGKKVAFKSSSKYLTTSTARSATGETDTGADVTYSLKTKELASGTNGAVASVSDADDGLVTAKNVAETINQTYWTAASGKSGSGSQTDETANAADKQISAGDTVTFNAGNNLSLIQNGASFTYGLQTDLTGMNTIRFGGTLNNGSWSGGLLVGNQAGSGANTAEGYYITGLSNTKWDRATISETSSMAATEGQLKQAIENITKSGDGTGGFGLTADSGEAIMQDLRKTIQIKGDGEGKADGNITTPNEDGVLRIRLNKTLNLSKDGSVQVGSSKVSNGAIQLGEDADTNKILMDSANGTATIGGVTINGANKTISGLSNTAWETAKATQDVSVGGYRGSTKAATESQLAAAISTATTTAAQNEQHIQAGNYEVGQGKGLDGKAIGKNSIAINVISGDGTKSGDVKGQVVINNVAKANELGDVGAIAKDIQNKNGDATKPTSVVEAINNLNDKVGDKKYSTVQGKEIADGDSATTAIGKLNNRMNDIYTTAGQHSSVSKADDNLTISESKNASGGTDYKIGLNKEQIDLGNVIIKGNEGSISAKSMTSDSFTAGDTVVNKDGIKVGDKSAMTSDSLKVNGKTYISSDGLNANSQKITNVQTGTADTDAANVGQMREADAQLADAIQQTDAGLNEVGRAVNKLGNRLNRVGAGAAALAALHPGTYDPNDKWDFSAGIGHYHDANAVAIGAYYHPNDTTILSIGGSMGGGENMVNAGITWKMGRSSHEQAAQPVVVRKVQAAPAVQQVAPVRPAPVVTPAPVTTPAPVKSVASTTPVQAVPAVTTPMTQTTTSDTAALAQILARQTAILEKLAQNQAQSAPSAAVPMAMIFSRMCPIITGPMLMWPSWKKPVRSRDSSVRLC